MVMMTPGKLPGMARISMKTKNKKMAQGCLHNFSNSDIFQEKSCIILCEDLAY